MKNILSESKLELNKQTINISKFMEIPRRKWLHLLRLMGVRKMSRFRQTELMKLIKRCDDNCFAHAISSPLSTPKQQYCDWLDNEMHFNCNSFC